MDHSSKLGRQELPRTIGCMAASEMYQEKAEQHYVDLLGSRFISTYVSKRKNYQKRIVEYVCKCCGLNLKANSTSTAIVSRNGVCNQCKDEDIV